MNKREGNIFILRASANNPHVQVVTEYYKHLSRNVFGVCTSKGGEKKPQVERVEQITSKEDADVHVLLKHTADNTHSHTQDKHDYDNEIRD